MEVGDPLPAGNGWLTGAARLWPTACFNIATGDVEDAPALDPLGHFDILEKDGGVYIRGEEAFLRANRRALKLKCSAQGPEHVVVVGG